MTTFYVGDLHALSGNIGAYSAGYGIRIREGSNCKMGLTTLVAGTVTVNTTAVGANSRIMLTIQTASGSVGSVYVNNRTAGSSFVIKSTNAADTSTVAWVILDPAVDI
ncbi:hypothetical protein ACFYW9_19285 [Streptomyces sp. NPDC002698]|uniref:hypothetical protein n=1 Tax=Streptomyces sp. NPDC002698 TaxID=3364660 RepID=UPI0036AB420B